MYLAYVRLNLKDPQNQKFKQMLLDKYVTNHIKNLSKTEMLLLAFNLTMELEFSEKYWIEKGLLKGVQRVI